MIKAKTYLAAATAEAEENIAAGLEELEIDQELEAIELERLRDELAIHAPPPPVWYQPKAELAEVFDYEERARRLNFARIAGWPWAYADAVLSFRAKEGGQ